MSQQLAETLGVWRSLLIYYGQPWRRRALKRFYGTLISSGDLVFDIGAHVGSRSKTLTSLGAAVVAIEPQPAFANFIEKHLAKQLRGFERVAIGANPGEITLKISHRHPTVSSTSRAFINGVGDTEGFRKVVWDSQIRVPMTTLDALIGKYGVPAFCKIDCEGAEAEILHGLSTPVKLLAFEYTPAMPTVAQEAIEVLGKLGNYQFNRVIGEHHHFVETDWKSADEVLADLAALNQDSPFGDIYARLET